MSASSSSQQEPEENKKNSESATTTTISLPTAEDIFLAVKSDNVTKLQQIVATFIENDIDPQEKFNSARTVNDLDTLPILSYALVQKSRNAFLFLLNSSGQNQKNFCVSSTLVDEAMWNALTHAVESNNVEAVKILLDSCSSSSSNQDSNNELRKTLINQRTSEDWFPLTYAICNGNVEIVKMLLQVPEIDLESTVDEMSHEEIAEVRKYGDIVEMIKKRKELNKK